MTYRHLYEDVHKVLDEHIEKYELMLERNENDCDDKEIISAILQELHELKEEFKKCTK